MYEQWTDSDRASATIRSEVRRRSGARILGLTFAVAVSCIAGRVLAADNTALHLANVNVSSTSYVRIPNTPAFALQQFTIEAWVQQTGVRYGFTTDPVGGAVVSKPAEGTVGSYLGSWYLLWSNAGKVFFSVAHMPSVNGVALPTAAVGTPLAWHHLAAVVAADSVRVYIDGVFAAGAEWTLGSVDVGVNDVLIRACNFGSGFLRRLDGTIDNVRIWDHARTASQIGTFMNCRLSGSEPGLVAYYRFDASSLVDDSGHGHTGTVVATSGALTFAPLATLASCVVDVEAGVRRAIPRFEVSPRPRVDRRVSATRCRARGASRSRRRTSPGAVA